jgi:hypothetical protein
MAVIGGAAIGGANDIPTGTGAEESAPTGLVDGGVESTTSSAAAVDNRSSRCAVRRPAANPAAPTARAAAVPMAKARRDAFARTDPDWSNSINGSITRPFSDQRPPIPHFRRSVSPKKFPPVIHQPCIATASTGCLNSSTDPWMPTCAADRAPTCVARAAVS